MLWNFEISSLNLRENFFILQSVGTTTTGRCNHGNQCKNRSEKKPVLEEISAQVESAQCVLLVNYSGLTVAQDAQLRKELREASVHYKVYKNTMMKRAFAGTALESYQKNLDGTNAIAIQQRRCSLARQIIARSAVEAGDGFCNCCENYYDKSWNGSTGEAFRQRENCLARAAWEASSPRSRKPGSRPQPDRRVQRRSRAKPQAGSIIRSLRTLLENIQGGKIKWQS